MTAQRARPSMGTLVAIEATSDSLRAVASAIDCAFAAIEEVVDRLHPRGAHSDLCRIHRAALHTRVEVHASTAELLLFAQRLHSLTGGRFDPCLPTRPGRLGDLVIEHADRSGEVAHFVTCRSPLALDLGGFAKGYAVDRAIDVLRENGCSAGLVNAGGDLRVFGARKEPLLLRRANGHFHNLELVDQAIAVSDADHRGRPSQHQGYYDPLRSRGAMRSPLVKRYAAIVAEQAVVADALAKCVLLCPQATAWRALQEFGAAQIGEG
ncbi:MAG TPA: FAD:protein FMN transferase [Steroidobacteraceae bacterium]